MENDPWPIIEGLFSIPIFRGKKKFNFWEELAKL